jgi:Transposase DDE domain
VKSRRNWRKLHLALDANNGEIIAQRLTDQDTDDPSQMGPLLSQIDGKIDRFMADGAYDGKPAYQAILQHSATAIVVIPPRSTAVASGSAGPPGQRDKHIAAIAKDGRLKWQAATGYGKRALIETAIGRYKASIGRRLRTPTGAGVGDRARTETRQGRGALPVRSRLDGCLATVP